MRTVASIFYFLLTIVGTLFLHSMGQGLLPFPLNQINFLLIFFSWRLLVTQNNQVFWQALVSAIVVEYFSTLPFGLNTMATLSSLFVFSYLLRSVFTNVSTSIVMVSGLLIGLSYRLFLLLFLLLLNLGNSNVVLVFDFSKNWLIEAILNTALLVILYLVSSKFSNRLKLHYIHIDTSHRI